MNKKLIRLTESDLHRIVKESVENILINESGYDNSVEDDIRVAFLKASKAARNAAFDAAGAVSNDTDAQKLKAAKAAFNAAIDAAIAATKSSAMMNKPRDTWKRIDMYGKHNYVNDRGELRDDFWSDNKEPY